MHDAEGWVCCWIVSVLCVPCLALVLTGGERFSRTPWVSWPEGIPRSRRLTWTTGTQGMSACKVEKCSVHLPFFMPTPGLRRTWRESHLWANRRVPRQMPAHPHSRILFQDRRKWSRSSPSPLLSFLLLPKLYTCYTCSGLSLLFFFTEGRVLFTFLWGAAHPPACCWGSIVQSQKTR